MKKQSNPSSDDPDKIPEFFLDKDKIEKTEDVLEEKEKSETKPAKKNFFKKRSNSDKKSFNTKLAKQETSLTDSDFNRKKLFSKGINQMADEKLEEASRTF